jgi:hypothetical protein
LNILSSRVAVGVVGDMLEAAVEPVVLEQELDLL